MKFKYLYFAISVSGASVLAVEILGTRILGPAYGVSLFLWSALITVTLAALAAGYALGGRWADRGATMARLCLLLAAAGAWLIAVPWLRDPLLRLAEGAELRAAALISALVLFFPPLMLLGMVTPYAVKLRAASLTEVGRSAGNLYAVSTMASVASAIATGFVLIPRFGVRRLTLAIGAVLIATAIPGLLKGRGAAAKICGIAIFAALLFAAAASPERGDPRAGLVEIIESSYAEIRVVDVDDLRLMLIDGSVHTEVDASTLDSRSAYVEVLELAGRYHDGPGAMLLVGLGGGALVKRFAAKGWEIDAVEIDPEVTRIARSHFGLEPSEARIFHMDGREFLKTGDAAYDLVILDAFGSSSIPFHLITREAFAELKLRLAPAGVLAMNVIAVGWDDVLVRSVGATLREEFANVLILPLPEPPNTLGNIILFASDRDLGLAEDPPVPDDRFSADYHRAHAWDNRFEADPGGARVITDDLNPVDLWAERVNLATRGALREYFGSRGIGW